MNHFKSFTSERAGALFELALILPLLTFMIFGVYEVNKLWNQKQSLIVYADTVAKDVARSCTKDRSSACIDAAIKTLTDILGTNSGIEIIGSIYSYKSSAVERTAISPTGAQTSSGKATKYDTTKVGSIGVLDANADMLSIVEVFSVYKTRFPFVKNFTAFGAQKDLYAVAMY